MRVRKLLIVTGLVLAPLVHCGAANNDGPFPRLLPAAEEFRLTLREEPQSKLLLGPSCGGEASLTLLCHAFTVTLENVGSHTIRISGLSCFEPSITFEIKQPNSTTGWWPLSQPGNPACKTVDWTNTRLRPGEHTQYSTRLISQRRWFQSVGPGQYTIRAQWVLFGCTESPEGDDCLGPLQDVHAFGNAARVGLQEPVTVFSNTVTVESPQLGELGGLKFAFEVTVNAPPERDPACTAANTNVECTVFHYVIRNLADRPVRNATFSCSDISIRPEYRFDVGVWKPVPQRGGICASNVLTESVIMPGGALEGSFTMRTLRPGYDTSSLQAPGQYQFRFTFWPSACIASPDASFCITRPEKQPTVTSKELTLQNPKLQPGPG
jgi:hypothetical protein